MKVWCTVILAEGLHNYYKHNQNHKTANCNNAVILSCKVPQREMAFIVISKLI